MSKYHLNVKFKDTILIEHTFDADTAEDARKKIEQFAAAQFGLPPMPDTVAGIIREAIEQLDGENAVVFPPLFNTPRFNMELVMCDCDTENGTEIHRSTAAMTAMLELAEQISKEIRGIMDEDKEDKSEAISSDLDSMFPGSDEVH